MKINIPGRYVIPYPSIDLQNAVIMAGNVWTDSNELSTTLAPSLVNESNKGVRMFKYRSWWYWYDFGDGTPGQARPMVWLRSFTKPTVGTPSPGGSGSGPDLEDAISDSTVTAITPHAVKVGTVQTGNVNQDIDGSKRFLNNIDAVSITTSRTELVLKQTGDDIGATAIVIQNRLGVNGIQVRNEAIPVSDVGLKSTVGVGVLLRLENRPEYLMNTEHGADGEFQVKMPIPNEFYLSNLFSVGRKYFIVPNNRKMGINTKTPTEMLEVAGNVKANYFIGDGSRLTNLPLAWYHLDPQDPNSSICQGSPDNFRSNNPAYTFGYSCTFGVGTTNLTIGDNAVLVTTQGNCSDNVIERSVRNITMIDTGACYIHSSVSNILLMNSTGVEIQANCRGLQFYNCTRTDGTKLVIPQGTINKIYRDGVQVASPHTLTFRFLPGETDKSVVVLPNEIGAYQTATFKNVGSVVYYVNGTVTPLSNIIATDGGTVRVVITPTNASLNAYLILTA
jgi:hypothetical protein